MAWRSRSVARRAETLAGGRDQVAATGDLTRRLEDLQLTTGEGPCPDAYRNGVPVLAGDLDTDPGHRLGFGPEAQRAGASAVFSLPLQVGAVRLGTLDLRRADTGPLSREHLADALTLASLATEALLELSEPHDRDTGTADAPGRAGGEADTAWLEAGWLPDVHADVHIAAGMLSVRAGVDLRTALLRLRAHAFAHNEPIHDAARRVIGGDDLDPGRPGVQSGDGPEPGHPLTAGDDPPDESQDPETDP